MLTVLKTDDFVVWLNSIRDLRARARVETRIVRLELGNAGDVAPVGGGVSELRIDYGPGYRVYFVQRGRELVIVLGGGDKSTQAKDIASAIALAQRL